MRPLIFGLLIIGFIMIGMSCEGGYADSYGSDNYEIIAAAPRLQHVSEGQKIMTPYMQYPRIRLLRNGVPVADNFLLDLEITDYNGIERDNTINRLTYTDQEPNPNYQGPLFASVDGIAAYPHLTTYGNAENSPDFSFRFKVPGYGVEKEFRIYYIKDNEQTNLTDENDQRYTHQRDFGKNPPQEIPGDEFGGIYSEDEPSGFYGDFLLDPAEKDLFIELDFPQGDNWLNNQANQNLIISTLESIFGTADINLHVFIDFIQGNVPPQATWDDCKDILAREKHLQDGNSPPISLGRLALHFVLLKRWGGPIDQGYLQFGHTIQFFGNLPLNGVPQGEGRFEYECYEATYVNDGAALDSVGCVIFWDEIIDQNNESNYNSHNWSRLEVLCHDIAHEAGHALGIINPQQRIEDGRSVGCVMSHAEDDSYFRDKHAHSLDFYKDNIDNFNATDHADAINVKDLLGTHTTSIRTGWFP